jgi:hypothetical protein
LKLAHRVTNRQAVSTPQGSEGPPEPNDAWSFDRQTGCPTRAKAAKKRRQLKAEFGETNFAEFERLPLELDADNGILLGSL